MTTTQSQAYRLQLDVQVIVEDIDVLGSACTDATVELCGDSLDDEQKRALLAEPVWEGLVNLVEMALKRGVPGAQVFFEQANQEEEAPVVSRNAIQDLVAGYMESAGMPLDKRGSKAELSRRSEVEDAIISNLFNRPLYIPKKAVREALATTLGIPHGEMDRAVEQVRGLRVD